VRRSQTDSLTFEKISVDPTQISRYTVISKVYDFKGCL